MPETIKKEDGTEVEVFTQEEIDTQKTEAIDKYKEENPNDETLKTSIEEKETLLKEKEEELEKEKGKEKNFAKLRSLSSEDKEKLKAAGIELDEKDEAMDTLRDETKKEIAELRNEVSTGKRTEAINKLSDDIEERKKIKFHLDRLSKSDDDQEAFESNLKDAYFLTTKQEAQVPDYISSAGAGGGKQKEETSAGEKEIGNELGITDEDREKYSK